MLQIKYNFTKHMATIKDVALHAGVSVATISRFFSHPEKLSEKRRLLVSQAVEDLRYTPNELARNLIRSRSNTVMILMPSITHEFGSVVMEGADRVALARGYSTLIGQTNLELEAEAKFIDRLKSKLADGFIHFSSNVHPEMLDPAHNIPFVNVMECLPNASYPTVQIDDVKASYEMVNYLIKLGHKRIACLVGVTATENESPTTLNRLSGYKTALQENRISIIENYILEGDYSIISGMEAAQQIIDMPSSKRPTAVFCAADSMAIGLIKGLRDGGINCPEDISITGFDDLQLAAFMNPSLTTVRQPAAELGEVAMNMLIDLIEGKTIDNPNPYLPHEIIVRDSTRPL
jgi:LacI family repressor for deo operon, udp, cdd, tsx, nupC, and nupG